MDILASADVVVGINAPNAPVFGNDMPSVMPEEASALASFAEPENLQSMLNYFNLDSKDVYNSDTVSKMKLIHEASKESELDFQTFLEEVGYKVGGRFKDGFFDRAYAYLGVLQSQKGVDRKLKMYREASESLQKQKESYEGGGNL